MLNINELEKTYDGCRCGFQGYLVLPDCDIEDHGNRCARCVINSYKKQKENSKEWEEMFDQKVNELIAYAIGGECGGRTVEDCKVEFKLFVKDIND